MNSPPQNTAPPNQSQQFSSPPPIQQHQGGFNRQPYNGTSYGSSQQPQRPVYDSFMYEPLGFEELERRQREQAALAAAEAEKAEKKQRSRAETALIIIFSLILIAALAIAVFGIIYDISNSGKAMKNIPAAQNVVLYRESKPAGANDFDNFVDQSGKYTIEGVSELVRPSIVKIYTYSDPTTLAGTGSGIVLSEDGYIVTNHHVVDNASKLKVTLNDKRTFDAKVIGTDPTTEVALIKIDATDLPTIPIGNSDALRLGEWVLAIGSPYGLQNTITAGIVSAKGRSLQALPTQYSLESFIQTDAAVNPGNSGGALVNTKGELVGINTLIQSQTGSYIGYSFAVPTSIVKKVVVDLKEYGVVQRAMLGIGYNAIDEAFLESDKGKSTGIKEQCGIYVGEVYPGSAAEAAGIKTGDIITEINGVKIEGSAQVSEEIAKHRPNDKITVSVKRGSDVKQIEVVLRNKTGNTDVITKDQVSAYDALNGEFAEVSEKALKSLKIKGGAVVTGVHEGGLLDKAGIRRGSVITRINNSTISSVNDLNRITSAIESIEWINPDGTRDRLLIMPK